MHLENLLASKRFAILSEIEPPKGVDVSEMVSNALSVKGKVDAFVVPEMSNAVMRMSSLGAAVVLQKRGIEVVMQVCCRDRNRIALQADLLAAHACGIRSIMAVAGDDPSVGDHHEAKAVYDIDLLEVLRVIRSLGEGRDMAGIELAGAPDFLTGSTVNVGLQGTELERELEGMRQKIDAGARFLVTSPVFDLNALEAFLAKVDPGRIPIIPTVLLLKSVGMARYIQRHMTHISLPDGLLERLQRSPDKVRECIRIAAETAAQLKERKFAGVSFSTLGWENKLPEVLSAMGR
jgi:methylenetetrahydrofolate reductase (NADPH)